MEVTLIEWVRVVTGQQTINFSSAPRQTEKEVQRLHISALTVHVIKFRAVTVSTGFSVPLIYICHLLLFIPIRAERIKMIPSTVFLSPSVVKVGQCSCGEAHTVSCFTFGCSAGCLVNVMVLETLNPRPESL